MKLPIQLSFALKDLLFVNVLLNLDKPKVFKTGMEELINISLSSESKELKAPLRSFTKCFIR